MLADGNFLVIDQNAAVVHIEAPQDAEIVKWNAKLNETYIPFGKIGAEKMDSQAAQDANAMAKAESGAAVGRAVTKASKNYWNGNWDLADASQAKDFDWGALKKEELPEEMRKLDTEARQKYVETKLAERRKVQEEIQKLNDARNAWVSEERKKSATEGDETLDLAVTKTVREQAVKKGYQFGE